MSAATKLNRKEKATQLDEYALTGSSTRNILIGTVKQMFERGEIRTQTAAGNLIKLIQENKMEQVDAKMGKIQGAVSKNQTNGNTRRWNKKLTTKRKNERQPNTL